jgi:hypothetical protein
MTLDIVFRPLALEPKTFSVGDTVRVTASFQYTVGKDTSVTVQAGPYHYIAGILDRIGASFGSTEVSLPKALTPTEKQFTIDFKLSEIDAGTYGLLVEIPGTDINVKQDDVLIIAAAPSIWGMIGPLLVLGLMVAMMSMMAPMMKEEESSQ